MPPLRLKDANEGFQRTFFFLVQAQLGFLQKTMLSLTGMPLFHFLSGAMWQ